jgi:hypothetical protein
VLVKCNPEVTRRTGRWFEPGRLGLLVRSCSPAETSARSGPCRRGDAEREDAADHDVADDRGELPVGVGEGGVVGDRVRV